MTECSEIGLLLGAFEDGELEPHEMREVARHLVECAACEGVIADYDLLGLELRECAPGVPVEGFKEAVLERIERSRPALWMRLGRRVDRLGEQLNAARLAMAATAMAVAALTAVVLTPLTNHVLGQSSGSALSRAPTVVARNTTARRTALGAAGAGGVARGTGQQIVVWRAGDSRAEISRLETESPDTAVWSEPYTGTTVIWLSDQPR